VLQLGQTIKIGLMEIRGNKLGSFLTMLGVIFGVAAVIASVAIGEGARQQAMEQVAQLGLTNIRIRALDLSGHEQVAAIHQNPDGLARQDMEAIEVNCPFAYRMAPVKELEDKPVFEGSAIHAAVIGVTPEYAAVMNFHPAQGRFLADLDMETVQRVCVIGAEIHQEIFGSAPWNDVSGNWLQIGDSMYSVIGIMEDKRLAESGSSAVSVRNVNRDVYVPLSAVGRRFSRGTAHHELSELIVQVRDRSHVKQAAELIDVILKRTHNGVNDYDLIVPLDLLRQAQATQRRFNMVLAAIAAISLLVGGIGIMNIMLAGVTQRTREIGIRRALGATRKDILGQFLLEAVVLSLVGGFFGIAAGFSLGAVISYYAGWKTIFSFGAVVMSVLVAGSVGIAAGFFPARRAAGLNPIEALRYE
jgi:putative ABC transport system permease protein